MDREDIIKLARAAGCHDNGEEFRFVEFRYLERFVALVAAAERQAIRDRDPRNMPLFDDWGNIPYHPPAKP